jgi:hypothetical protein
VFDLHEAACSITGEPYLEMVFTDEELKIKKSRISCQIFLIFMKNLL